MKPKKIPEEGKDFQRLLEEVQEALQRDPDNIALLRRRAELLQHLGRYGDALNGWLRIEELQPGDKETRQHIRYLEEILKYTNLDIFSDPNTHHDPWL